VLDLPCFGASRVLVRSELKLGVGIVLHSVSSCDMCQVIYRVDVDPTFFDQYILLLEHMYEE
jgi:hypothetical protein